MPREFYYFRIRERLNFSQRLCAISIADDKTDRRQPHREDSFDVLSSIRRVSEMKAPPSIDAIVLAAIWLAARTQAE
jgi:hypothetical protein